jgi:EF hand
MGLGNLELTFETLVNAFVFLDKNKDGYVSREEMVQAINETTSGERSSGRIAMKRFGQSVLFSLIRVCKVYYLCFNDLSSVYL